ncbi:hypothetical protein M5K25_023107 [Dendrobium thyrsiflorum]|uniref:Uncharacterized protein n=1 Tax=Dendrobium thyrsiflorum TaxID=117978 RepID=A0ABD0U7B5_DENTH
MADREEYVYRRRRNIENKAERGRRRFARVRSRTRQAKLGGRLKVKKRNKTSSRRRAAGGTKPKEGGRRLSGSLFESKTKSHEEGGRKRFTVRGRIGEACNEARKPARDRLLSSTQARVRVGFPTDESSSILSLLDSFTPLFSLLCQERHRMVGEWMMDPIKIPWFRHPGSSWSLVYLVRGGSRPNLTEGSLSAAMGCFVQGYLVDLGDAIWWRITWFRGPRVITVYPAVPFGGKTAGQRTRTTSLLARDYLRMDPIRVHSSSPQVQVRNQFNVTVHKSPVVQILFRRNFGSLPASPPFRGKSERLAFPSSPHGRFRLYLREDGGVGGTRNEAVERRG